MKNISPQITAKSARRIARDINRDMPISQLNFILAQIDELSQNGKFEFFVYDDLHTEVIAELNSREFVVSDECDILHEVYRIISWE